jgi:large subunit ribosomal protein L21
VPKPSGPLTAVFVSGGKQYRVAPGDRILVDRLAAEPGSELTLDRVLLVSDGQTTKVGLHELRGQAVTARVIGHRRGPKVDVIRYKPKKRVRVHRGARADLTALEILGIGAAKDAEKVTKAPRAEKAEKAARPEDAEKATKAPRAEKAEKAARPESAEKAERPAGSRSPRKQAAPAEDEG